jgi:putative membrane protein
MIPAHGTSHPGAGGREALVPLLAVVLVALLYVVLASRRRREQRGWSSWRTASFLSGLALLVLALVPALSPYPAGNFRGHMHQHLLIGMLAPLGLVLGAPVTLLLRSLPRRRARQLGRALRSRPAHLVANPVTALILTLGGLTALYFTPLYELTSENDLLHHLVHAHFLAAGYLFAWVIAGPDPAPRRPSVPVRLVVLGIAIAGHSVVSQLMYAGAFVQVPVPVDQLRAGGELMYYGGDIAELLLALALVTSWRPRKVASKCVVPSAPAALTLSTTQPHE